MQDITSNQLHRFLAGTTAVRPLVSVWLVGARIGERVLVIHVAYLVRTLLAPSSNLMYALKAGVFHKSPMRLPSVQLRLL